MYSIASSTADIATSLTNTGLVVAAVITGILGGYIALMGLGFAIRKIRGKILGGKF